MHVSDSKLSVKSVRTLVIERQERKVMAVNPEIIHRFAHVIKEPMRVRIILALAGGPKTVNELVSAMSLKQPTISNHLRVLTDNNMVKRRRDGRMAYYSSTSKKISRVLEAIMRADAEMLASRGK